MPNVGESSQTVLVLEWKAAVGSVVVQGDPLLVVETDKVEVEVPSPISGTVTTHLVLKDDEPAVGAPICVIED